MNKKIIVIGSGFGGLAAAIRLATKGYQVEIFEKRDKLGGRAYVYEQNGFKFDGGPTVITAPFLFDELFAAAGKRREDYITFVPCDPYYRIFNPVLQGERFDPDGNYVRRWVPELAHLAGRAAHTPWDQPDGYAGGYPLRMVDHAQARDAALGAYRAAKEAATPA